MKKLLFSICLFLLNQVFIQNPLFGQTIYGGGNHSMVICDDSTVWISGSNSSGQLGDGSTISKAYPVQVPGISGAIAVAAGLDHSLVLLNDGTVWSCGANNYGQLGDNSITNRTSPVQVTGLTSITAISAGKYHSMALKSNGTLWIWGQNDFGQLGDGTTANSLIPKQVLSLSNVSAIAGGGSHSLALLNDNTIWACGLNGYGQLGDSTVINKSSMVKVLGLSNVAFIAAGSEHSLAIKTDGTAWAWGYNGTGQLGDGTTTEKTKPIQILSLVDVLEISGGQFHTIALKDDGSFWAWGFNGNGQLGDGTSVGKLLPVQITSLSNGVDVSLGLDHSITLLSNGNVWSFGKNLFGQLGDSTTADTVVTPTKMAMSCTIPGPCYDPVADFSYSDSSLIVDFTDLSARAVSLSWDFGDGNNSILQNPTHTYAVPGSYTVCLTATNSCSSDTTCQLITISCLPTALFTSLSNLLTVNFTDQSEGVVSWSWDFGDGNTDNTQNPAHTYAVSGLYNVCLIVTNPCGSDTICHLLDISCSPVAEFNYSTNLLVVNFADQSTGATSWSWDFGDGNTDNTQNPSHTFAASGVYNVCLIVNNVCGPDTICKNISVSSNSAHPIIRPRIFGGGFWHTMVLCENKSLWIGGSNMFNQLGDTSVTTNALIPINVVGPTNISSISGGYYHSMAIDGNGDLWTWGYNVNGQLGHGTTTNVIMPQKISGFPDIAGISGGMNHSLIFDINGNIWAFGSNTSGQLGDSTLTQRNSPVQPIGLSNIIAVAAGSNFSVALRDDGTVWTWGVNFFGQLGNDTSGSGTNRKVAGQVVGLTNVIDIAAGNGHVVALTEDGNVWTWGGNMYGQIGDSTTGMANNRKSPTLVKAISGIIEISAGSNHTMALRNDSTLWVWGYNAMGQLGDSTAVGKTFPMKVDRISGVVAIQGAGYHTIALKRDGTVWTWGNNGQGQLGDSTQLQKRVPVQMQLPCIVTPPCPKPISSFSYTDSGFTVTFTDLSENGVSYDWDFGDGNSSSFVNPVHTYSNSGFYDVCLTIYNKCNQVDSICTTVPIQPDGIETARTLNYARIYPNPARERVAIDFHLNSSALVDLTVMNPLGETIYNSLDMVSTGPHTLQLGEGQSYSIPAGVYIIKLNVGEKESYTIKLVKLK